MNKERMYQVLQSPIVSEKSAELGDTANQAVFKVVSDATKAEISTAVAQLFDVKVERVTTLNLKPKKKQFRGQPGYRNGFKKAYVTLAAGEEIDFLDGITQ